MRYKRLQKIGVRATFKVAQEVFYSERREKAVITRYNGLQHVSRCYKNNAT